MDAVVEFISRNPYLVIFTFAVSFLANFIQISTYFRDRARIREEREESQRLFAELEKYRYVVGMAERNIKTEEELKEVEEDIEERQRTAREVEQRMHQMTQLARYEVAQNAIDRRLRELLDAYEDVTAFRAQYASLGPLPAIPEAAKAQIEHEVSIALQKPYELPKAFSFRALLLVLLISFVPWPINSVVTLIFLHVFLELFFEAAHMYSGRVAEWVRKHANRVGFGSAVAGWYVLLNFVENIAVNLLQAVITSVPLWPAAQLAVITISLIAGALHWRAIRRQVLAVYNVSYHASA